MLIARITDLLSHTWNIPIVDKMISIWFSMRVSLVKISGCRGMFTEWLVEPKGVWSAQPGGCAGIAHTWFFETSCGIQTMQSQKTWINEPNPTPPVPMVSRPEAFVHLLNKMKLFVSSLSGTLGLMFLYFLQMGCEKTSNRKLAHR